MKKQKADKTTESAPGVERRSVELTELRVLPDGDKKKITGYAAVFEKMSEDLGGFKEIIERGAFKKALKKSDTRALWNHDPSVVLGRVSAKTLRLKEDEQGLRIEIDPPSWAGSYMESIERGDVREMSFGFTVETDKWETKDGMNLRTILAVRELPDVSPVTFPAYPDTSLALRSMQAWADAAKGTDDDETVEHREDQTTKPADETVNAAETLGKLRDVKLKLRKYKMEVTEK